MTDSLVPDIAEAMITTGDQLREAREALGWTCYAMGVALALTGEREAVRKRIDQMETGAKPVSGPVGIAVEAFRAGFRPRHFDPDIDPVP